jgi:hypothetical protein
MRKHNHLRITAVLISLLYGHFSNAQIFDSLQANIGLETRLSSMKYQPLWLIANRHGVVTDRKSDLLSFVHVSNKNVLAQREYTDEHGFSDYNDISISYGLSIYNGNHFRSTTVEEAYGKLEYKNWSLHGGRFEEDIEDIDPLLSSGSLGVSGNALPIPKIGIAVTAYTNVPFTNGWLQFRGSFAHGWLGTDRYVKNSFYHEKTFFLRAGPGNFKLYGGIQHFVEWGGHRGDEQFDRSLKGFWNVLFAKGDDGTDAHAGDQRGVLEGGFYLENGNAGLHGYFQKPFEGKNDINIGNKNMLAGFILSMKDKDRGLQKILVEVISTKNINDHVAAPRRESLYNNAAYKTGWEYQNNIIGSPLLVNRERGSQYFPQIQPFDWNLQDDDIPGNANIIDNRIFGVHTGALYTIDDMFSGRTLLTFTKNYGTINDASMFAPYKNQFYGLQEIYCYIPDKNLTITAGIGFDHGELSNAVAGLIGIKWNLNNRKADYDVNW